MTVQTEILMLAEGLLSRGWSLVTAESCTAGAVAARLTEQPGSSAWVEGGFITYSNAMKQRLLGIEADLIEQQGAVSQACVEAMAQGALVNSSAQVSVAISGIAGPDGGSAGKPVGTVWIAWTSINDVMISRCFKFNGDRESVRDQAVVESIHGLLSLIVD